MFQDHTVEFNDAARQAGIAVPLNAVALLLSRGWSFDELVKGLDDESITSAEVVSLFVDNSINFADALNTVFTLSKVESKKRELESKNRELESKNRELESKNRELALAAELARLTVSSNRTSLFTTALKSSALVDDWLALFDTSNIPAIPDEESFLTKYMISRSMDTSFTFSTVPSSTKHSHAEAPSSTKHSHAEAHSTLPMELFDRAQLSDPGTNMPVYLLELDDAVVASLIREKGFGDNPTLMETAVVNLESILRKLREAVYFGVFEADIKCSELDVIQPMFMFLILRAMQYVLPKGEAEIGQNVALTAAVLADVEGGSAVMKTLTGHADILCYSSATGELAETLTAICEVKKAFSKLCKGAKKAKEQLLAELEGGGQMVLEGRHIVGMLSDLFAICLIIRAPSSPERNNHPVYYQGRRETSTRSFVLRLLLALLNLSAADYDALLKVSTTKLEVSTDDAAAASRTGELDTGSIQASTGNVKGQGAPGGSRSSFRIAEQGKGQGTSKENVAQDGNGATSAERFEGLSLALENNRDQAAEQALQRQQQRQQHPTRLSRGVDCPEYRVALHKEAVQMAIERDYARRGLAYLSEDELERRNLDGGSGKRDIRSLL